MSRPVTSIADMSDKAINSMVVLNKVGEVLTDDEWELLVESILAEHSIESHMADLASDFRDEYGL